MSRSTPLRPRLLALILTPLLLLPLPGGTTPPPQLPEMGEHALTALTAEEAARIGQSMYRDLRRADAILNDIECNHYLQQLALQLLAGRDSRHATPPVSFIIDNAAINAFALPGGYIGINSGLIIAARSESELAAVVAHELAHVSQQHIARRLERADASALPLTAAMIAAILLGGDNSHIAQAAIASGVASQVQQQIDFTRDNEQEADRIGIELLLGSGFDSRAMASFFERLAQQNRYSADIAPEYLRTHPVTDSRISDARHRATQQPPPATTDETPFEIFQARVEILTSDEPERLLTHYQARADQHDIAGRYGTALLLSRLGREAEAIAQLRELLNMEPHRIAFRLAAAQSEDRRGESGAALALLREGLDLYPGNPRLILKLAESALLAGEPQLAHQQLRQLLATADPTLPAISYQRLAQAEAAIGDIANAQLAQANYYAATGDHHAAITQLRALLRDSTLDDYTAARAQARLKELEQLPE